MTITPPIASHGLVQDLLACAGQGTVAPEAAQWEAAAIARRLQAFAAVTIALSGSTAGEDIAAALLQAIGEDVAAIALYLAPVADEPARLHSCAGFAGAPPAGAAEALQEGCPEWAGLIATGPGERAWVASAERRPGWVGPQVPILVALGFGGDVPAGSNGCVLFALRRCGHAPSLLALLRMAAQRAGEYLAAWQRNDLGADLAAADPEVRIRVLLIDDEPLMLAHIKRLLQREGFHVQVANDARAGLAMAEDLRPDVILVDKVMPDMDGLELLRAVRAHGALSTVPVIMLSGRADEEQRVGALGAGADDFVIKPFSAKDLVARVQAHVRLVRIRRSAVRREGELIRLRQSQQELRTLLHTVQNVRADERRRLAREVHDQLGQVLTAVKIDIRLLQDRLVSSQVPLTAEQVSGHLQTALASVDQAIESVQDISVLLRPPALEEGGLVAALRWQAADFKRRAQIDCSFGFDPRAYVEPPAFVAGELLRMCQEALTNVLRHADASSVRIDLAMRGQMLLLRVCDNGRGIARGKAAAADSIGLKGMSERAASIRATLQVHGRPGRGTMVSIRRRQGIV